MNVMPLEVTCCQDHQLEDEMNITVVQFAGLRFRTAVNVEVIVF
jgi:hypothetical protein